MNDTTTNRHTGELPAGVAGLREVFDHRLGRVFDLDDSIGRRFGGERMFDPTQLPAAPRNRTGVRFVLPADSQKRGGYHSVTSGGEPVCEAPVASQGHAQSGKWAKMDFLRKESVRKRQQACQLYPRGEHVSIRSSAEFGTGFAGLQSCGSITCPHCGSKIMAERRDEIETAIESAEREGLQLLFGTFTIRHRLGQSMDALASVIARGWAGVTSGSGWAGSTKMVGDKERFGIVGWVRVWETKYSRETGWHVHVHYLLFVRPVQKLRQAKYTDDLQGRLFARWARAVGKLGDYAPSSKGQDLRLVVGADAKIEFGKYLTKQMTQGKLGFELASSGTKVGRISLADQTSFEPSELLEHAMQGDDQALALWNEYELTMQGRRTIGWSRGLRDLLALGVEKSDEEIAAEEAGTVEDTVITMLGSQFVRFARRRGARAEMLAILDEFGAEWLVWWLSERGVTATLGAAPPS